jgi:hypothetical protein
MVGIGSRVRYEICTITITKHDFQMTASSTSISVAAMSRSLSELDSTTTMNAKQTCRQYSISAPGISELLSELHGTSTLDAQQMPSFKKISQ